MLKQLFSLVFTCSVAFSLPAWADDPVDVRYICDTQESAIHIYRNDLIPKQDFSRAVDVRVPWRETYVVDATEDDRRGNRYVFKRSAPIVASCVLSGQTFILSFSSVSDRRVTYGFEGPRIAPTISVSRQGKKVFAETELAICSPERSNPNLPCAIHADIDSDKLNGTTVLVDRLVRQMLR